MRRDYARVFGGLRHVRRVLLEAGDLSAHGDDPGREDLFSELWVRDVDHPVVVRQRFATSSEASVCTPALLGDLDLRRVGSALLLVCGNPTSFL